MIRLVRFGVTLPKLRCCGNSIATTECIRKIAGATRSYMTKTSETMESRLKARDMVPEGFRIIYRGGMDNYVHLAHQSSTLLTFFGIGGIYKTFYIEDEIIQFPVKIGISPVGLESYTQVFIMYAAFFIFMFGMRQISSKYVIRMYYNPTTKTYRAVKVGILPTATRSYNFQAGTLQRQTKLSFIPWMNCVYDADGTKIMLFEEGFKTSADFNRLFEN